MTDRHYENNGHLAVNQKRFRIYASCRAHLAQVAVGVPGGGSFERLPVRGVQLIPLVTHCLHVVLQQPTARGVSPFTHESRRKTAVFTVENVP